MLANEVRDHFVANFKNEGFEDHHWQEVKRRIPGTPEYRWPAEPKAGSRSRPILTGTGALQQAVANSIVSADFKKILLKVTGVPYAAVHNNGLKLSRGTGNMPQRKFMGDSAELREKLKGKIKASVGQIWKTGS